MLTTSDKTEDYIRVSEHDFNVSEEYAALVESNNADGAVVFFVGLVRDFNQNASITELFLEHYPAMTEKSLRNIIAQARQRWQLGRVRLVHRVGLLNVNDQIVFVGVSSTHRQQSFAAAQYIMDYLKTEAPFWKKEKLTDGTLRWVSSEQKNREARRSWDD